MRLLLVLALPLLAISTARADETDDMLARQLAGVIRDPRPNIWSRVDAAQTLAKMGPRASAAVPELTLVLSRFRGAELEPLQEAVVEALGQIGSPAKSALPMMALASSRSFDIDQGVKRSTGLILTASDAQDVEGLIVQLVSRDPSIRLRAIKALTALGPTAQPAIPAIVAVLGDLDGDVRRGAIAALRLIAPTMRPFEGLIRAMAVDLSDPDPNVRLLAIRALGRIGPPAAVAAPAIEALRTDTDPDIRRAAVEALGRIVTGP